MDKHFKEITVKELIEDAAKQPDFNETYKQLIPLFTIQKLIIEEKIKNSVNNKQLSAQIGISQSELIKLEQADEKIRLDTLFKTAEYFGKALQILLT